MTSKRRTPRVMMSSRPSGYSLLTDDDFRRTPDFSNAVFLGAHHAEGFFPRPTFRDHLFVAGLKNVQRKRCAGKQNQIQGKQWQERAQP